MTEDGLIRFAPPRVPRNAGPDSPYRARPESTALAGRMRGSVAPVQGPIPGLVIAGFVCAFVFPLLGLVFSAVGLSQAARAQSRGEKLAVAGIVISIAWFLLAIVLAIG
jgi:hypothetical protein